MVPKVSSTSFGNLFIERLEKIASIEEKINLIGRNNNHLRLKCFIYKLKKDNFSKLSFDFSKPYTSRSAQQQCLSLVLVLCRAILYYRYKTCSSNNF